MTSSNDAIRLKAVNHVTYNVKDKERALRFWEDVLGIKQIPSQVESDRVLWLQLPDGTMVHLVQNDAGASVPSHHAAFEVDDIKGYWNHIRSNGVEATDITTRKDGQREFKFDDPDGNRIEICTKSGFGVLV
jgi:catechol 2,3-dioxygenase-like lactoylglutathione lyase family enzyme